MQEFLLFLLWKEEVCACWEGMCGLGMIARTLHDDGLASGLLCGDSFCEDICREQDTCWLDADVLCDECVAVCFLFGACCGVVVSLQVGEEIAEGGVPKEQLLGLNAA